MILQNINNLILEIENTNLTDKYFNHGRSHRAVIDNNPNLINSSDINLMDRRDKSSPLHYASQYNNHKMVDTLIRKGANIHQENKHGNQPLWYAVSNARGDYRSVKELMKHNPNINHKNKSGRSPLDFARIIKDKKLENILLKNDPTRNQ